MPEISGFGSAHFKDFDKKTDKKCDIENAGFAGSAAPAGRHVPERAIGLGLGGAGGQTDVGQTGGIQPAQRLTLTVGDKAKAKGFGQTVEGALHLDATDRHRGGGDRGKHDLSFQGHLRR
jgi:hypothetical protein